MLRLPQSIRRTLSVRISLTVVLAIGLLLMASMGIMLYYSRKAVKEEALQKASQTLESTVQRIDNIILSVEQTTGNIFFSLLPYMDSKEKLLEYSHRLVENNPYVQGCAIAMKEDFFEDGKPFMAYYFRKDSTKNVNGYYSNNLIQSEVFGDRPYTQQVWFTQPMETRKALWLNPLTGMNADIDPLVTFSLPLYKMLPAPDSSKEAFSEAPVGVIGVDISLKALSDIVEETKLSEGSYCTLLNSKGEYIVHPDDNKLMAQAPKVLSKAEDASARDAAQAMMTGGEGYKPFRLNGKDYYVFYKSFERASLSNRALERLDWSVGIVYPEDDIFGNYNSLLGYVLVITVICLLLMFLLTRSIVHRQLKPLLMLTRKAERISQGHYDEPIPDSYQTDEIGQLQENFQLMQQRLSAHIGELEQLNTTLRERGEELQKAYSEAKKADRMKTAFLHNMTNQMQEPAEAIDRDVNAMLEGGADTADDIQNNSNRITELLNNLLNMSDEEKRTV